MTRFQTKSSGMNLNLIWEECIVYDKGLCYSGIRLILEDWGVGKYFLVISNLCDFRLDFDLG